MLTAAGQEHIEHNSNNGDDKLAAVPAHAAVQAPTLCQRILRTLSLGTSLPQLLQLLPSAYLLPLRQLLGSRSPE
jgi:hypothetical protein